MASRDQIRILLVDDRTHVRKLVRYMLNRAGFKNITEAGDGREAFNLLVDANINHRDGRAKEREFRIVIADWIMPNMNGLDLLRSVREVPNLKQLPFIMLTAESDRENIVNAVDAGVSDYIVKPFTSDVLETKVEKALAPLLKDIDP